MSLERRFGVGMFALGTGQAALAVSTLLGPDSDGLTGWATVVLAVAAFGLGALTVTGRMQFDVTDTQRRLVRVTANAAVVGGVTVTLAGGLLVVAHFL